MARNRSAFTGNSEAVKLEPRSDCFDGESKRVFLYAEKGVVWGRGACFAPSRDILSATVGSSRCRLRRFSTTPLIPWPQPFPLRGLTTFSAVPHGIPRHANTTTLPRLLFCHFSYAEPVVSNAVDPPRVCVIIITILFNVKNNWREWKYCGSNRETPGKN